MKSNKTKYIYGIYVDMYLLFSILFLLLLGIIMVYSSSVDLSQQQYGHSFHYFIRQLIYAITAIICCFGILKIDISIWNTNAKYLLFISITLLMVVLVPMIGVSVNGSRRWINLFIFRMQVAEIVKLFMVIYMASYIVRYNNTLQNKWINSFKPLILLSLVVILLLLQPDFGSASVVMITLLVMLFLGGLRLGVFLSLLLICAICFSLLAVFSPYRLLRITSFLNPWENAFSSGYQLTQSLIAFGNGGWLGLGLGSSIQKLSYLPESHTDFIFAILSEELGVLFGGFVILIYFFIFAKGTYIAIQAQRNNEHFHAFLSYGISFYILLQALINIGVNIGLFPTKGITLPLISYGGGSLIMTLVSLSVLLRVNSEMIMKKLGVRYC